MTKFVWVDTDPFANLSVVLDSLSLGTTGYLRRGAHGTLSISSIYQRFTNHRCVVFDLLCLVHNVYCLVADVNWTDMDSKVRKTTTYPPVTELLARAGSVNASSVVSSAIG